MNHSRKQAPHKGIIYVTPNKSASLKKNSQISPIKVGVFFLLVAMFMINLWLRLGLPGYYSPIEPITPIDATQEYVESRVDQPKDDTLCINHPQLGLPCEFPNKPGVQGMMLCPVDGRVPVCQEMPARKLAKQPRKRQRFRSFTKRSSEAAF